MADAQIELVANDVLAGLEHAGQFIRDGQWNDAVETLCRIMENHGDALMEAAVSPDAAQLGFARFIPLREHCQMELASWHQRAPEALAIYRGRVDDLARRWYEEAAAGRDEALLQRIADELPLSGSADQALLLLGELALQRGNYTLRAGGLGASQPAVARACGGWSGARLPARVQLVVRPARTSTGSVVAPGGRSVAGECGRSDVAGIP